MQQYLIANFVMVTFLNDGLLKVFKCLIVFHFDVLAQFFSLFQTRNSITLNYPETDQINAGDTILGMVPFGESN